MADYVLSNKADADAYFLGQAAIASPPFSVMAGLVPAIHVIGFFQP